jgi:SNF family Na+-dependent transporter
MNAAPLETLELLPATPPRQLFITADILLPLNSLLIALFLGWIWPHRDALGASDLDNSLAGRLWHFSLRYAVPLLVALVLVRGVWGS